MSKGVCQEENDNEVLNTNSISVKAYFSGSEKKSKHGQQREPNLYEEVHIEVQRLYLHIYNFNRR